MLLFELSKDHPDLAAAEVQSFLNASLQAHSLLIARTQKSPEYLQSRLALTRSIHLILFKADSKNLLSKIKSFPFNKHYRHNFSITVHDPDNKKEFTASKLAPYVWHNLKDPKVKLNHCSTPIHFFITKNLIYCTIKQTTPNNGFEKRRAHLRPFVQSSSLHPRIARCLINLLGIAEKDTLLDPCCGSGGFLIEAGLMGIPVKGTDINRILVWGCMANLYHYGIEKADILVGDALTIKGKYDYIITDLPYGRNSSIQNEGTTVVYRNPGHTKGIESFYVSFLQNLKHILVKKAVIIFPHYVDYRKLIKDAGLTLESEYSVYVHKSLTRVVTRVSI